MGYTHYWEIKSDPSDAEGVRRKFKRASGNIKRFAKFCETQDLFRVCGGLGEGKPIFNESEVWFNGDEKNELDHETFNVRWRDFLKNESRGFCKTAYKPYDLLVCFSILALAEEFKNRFTFSSDGDEQDWKQAFELYETFTGKQPRKFYQ